MLGLYKDNGREYGNYQSILGLYIGMMGKNMETSRIHWRIMGCIFVLASRVAMRSTQRCNPGCVQGPSAEREGGKRIPMCDMSHSLNC